jgi:exosortase/archaeosortase family protein
MERREVLSLVVRYGLLVVLGLGNLFMFYKIFTPLTVWPVFWVLDLIYGASLSNGSEIMFNGIKVLIIAACVAGAAYYLLLILNLTTRMKMEKRMKSLLFLFGAFLLVNIFRIIVFALLFALGFEYFNLAHEILWHFGSTVLLVVIWFVNVWIFGIKEIPVLGDVKRIVSSIRKNKK